MIYKNSIKYKQNKKGTSLSARFEYKEELEFPRFVKEDIQARLNLGDEFKNYLKIVEGLTLNSPYFACDGNGLGRHVGFYPNRKNLRLRIDILSNQQVSKKEMFNLDALDTFIAEGKYPEKQGEYRKV